MSQWIDPDYRGEEENGNVAPDYSSEDEFNQPPLKKQKSGVLTYSSFTEEDLHSFVARISMEQRKAVQETLTSEEGKVIGILAKMQDDRSNAIHRRLHTLNKLIWNKLELIDKKMEDMEKTVAKLDGMGKFTYAWCKSATEANVFKLKQR